jgi:dihydrodipicolinate synthase/N-acetylneuraminate lyase
MEISGIWLPIVTPFVNGAVDLAGYERMLTHYLARGVAGVFPLGTTGESPTLDEDEMEAVVDRTVSVVAGRVPVFVGIGGNATAKVLATLLRLAELRNIVGVKDSSGNLAQSLELLRLRPAGFAVLTGDDPSLYTMLAHGGDGGILASAHLRTERFIAVYERMVANDHHTARKTLTRVSRALADELDRALGE